MIYIVIFLKLYANHTAVRIMLGICSLLNIYVQNIWKLRIDQTSGFRVIWGGGGGEMTTADVEYTVKIQFVALKKQAESEFCRVSFF